MSKKDILLFDFDGVIKCSNQVKEDCFISLFTQGGDKIAKIISEHHRENSGMDRRSKIKYYLGLVEPASQVNILLDSYVEQFSKKIVDLVCGSDWVNGVTQFLEQVYLDYDLIIVTATPEAEIKEISNNLGLSKYFKSIRGYSFKKNKIEIISELLVDFNIDVSRCIFFGDSPSDFESAQYFNMDFVRVKTLDSAPWPVGAGTQLKWVIDDFDGFAIDVLRRD